MRAKGTAILNLNVRLSRTFASDLSGCGCRCWPKCLTLSNHVNVVTLNGVFGTGVYPTNPLPTFGQITAVNDPRSFQLALRLSF